MLKVWLPLDGDLRNLGASDIEVTNNGATVDNAGKIGKCYYFNGSAQYLQFNKTLGDIYSGDFSWCVWLKPTDNTRGIIFSEYAASGSSGVAFELLANRVIRVYWNGSPDWSFGISINKDEWSHVAITKKNNTIKVYVNGQYRTEKTGTLSARPSTACIRLGDDYRGGTNVSYMGYMNDARIYDHCLSAAEVHEIAMGLVLHYKLDASSEEIITKIPSTNVYNYPTFNTASVNGGWNHWGPSGHSGNYGQNTDKKYIYNKNNTYSHWIMEDAGTGKYYLLYQSPAFEGGYRSLQAIIKEENGLPITESICYPDWNARNGGIPNYKWTTIKSLGDGFYYCCCEGVSQDGSNDLIGIIVNPGYKIYVSECYLEDNTETCSPIFTYSSNIIQDSSGYGHNGTIISELHISNDSARYNNSTLFDGIDDCIIVPYNIICPENIFTINLWFKKDALGTKNYETLFGGPGGFEMDTRAGSATSLSLYMAPTRSGNRATGITMNEWHMITMTRDGTAEKYYVDGEFKSEIEAKSMPNGVYRIGAWASDTRQNYYGLISDFRIYCTPLLDTDIKLLYNVGMKIDNLGGVHTFELNENSSKNKLTKTGVLNNNIIESYLTLPDGSNWKLLLYHYVDGGNNLFTQSNATYCNDFGLYSRLKDINNYTYDGKYEFYVIQDGIEYRWTQTSQPTASSIAGLTTVEGYNNPVNGLAKANQSKTYIGYGSWWGACGCWTKYSIDGKTGIPGFGSHNGNGICEEYLALYTRVEKNNASFENFSTNSTEFIEI